MCATYAQPNNNTVSELLNGTNRARVKSLESYLSSLTVAMRNKLSISSCVSFFSFLQSTCFI